MTMDRPQWQRDLIGKEDGPLFLGTPDRWFGDSGFPRFRCNNNHVSKMGIGTENGLVCAAGGCGLPLWVTSPEDEYR